MYQRIIHGKTVIVFLNLTLPTQACAMCIQNSYLHSPTASSHGTTLTPFAQSRSSTSLSISSAVFPPSLYVEWAPESRVTSNPAASAPLLVDSTQHSLWIPKVMTCWTPAALSSEARSGFDSNVSPIKGSELGVQKSRIVSD